MGKYAENLEELLKGVKIERLDGSLNQAFHTLQIDSRKVTEGDVFIALSGYSVDGHDFINQAIESGASTIVYEKDFSVQSQDVTTIKVKDSREAISLMAGNYNGNPSEELKLVGVTGTNGKTTVATLLFKLLRQLGYKAGLLSTIHNRINDNILESSHTTPDPLNLNAVLRKMVDAGCEYAFMEVSSHALDQKRTIGLRFDAGIFTNITHDHLDYHKTFAEYIKAKKMLFDHLPEGTIACINIDDVNGKIMVQNTDAEVITYALGKMADYKGKLLENRIEGLHLEINGQEVYFKLVGRFNAYNILAVYATAVEMGHDSTAVLQILSRMEGAEGRFDYVVNKKTGITGIVDYAHTPDALENVLKAIVSLRSNAQKIITVVGCGGDRDVTKRPEMAGIAVRYSDRVILTSDNPRSENPETIIDDMMKGIEEDSRKVIRQADRKEAIKTAVMLADKGDILLIAGKGHEKYQEIKGIKYPFDDKRVLNEVLFVL